MSVATASKSQRREIAGRYVLGRLLGRGAYGEVFRSWDRVSQRPVALKLLADDAELADEYRATASLRHPYIVSVLAYGTETSGRPYYTMEVAGGTPFTEALAGAPPRDVLALAAQVLAALDHLEARGRRHGDLKPSNLLVGGPAPQRVTLLDLGMATRTSGIRGTPAYMAPELASGGLIDIRADLYALGVVLYETLAGHNPFLADSAASTIDRQTSLHPEALHRVAPSVDLGTSSFVSRLLEKNTDRRFRSAAKALEAIDELLGDGGRLRASVITAPPLVGRDAERERLASLLAELDAGRGAAVVLEGEPGTGRSELCREVEIGAQLAGVACGRSRATGSSAGLGCLRLALRIAGLDLHGPRSPGDSEAVEEHVKVASGAVEERPLVLIIEDVEHASDPLAQALARLVQLSDRRPLLLVLSRPVGPFDSGPSALEPALLGAEARGQGHRIRVGPLAGDALAELVEAALGGPADRDGLCDAIYRASMGIPADAIELLRHFAAAGELMLRDGRWCLETSWDHDAPSRSARLQRIQEARFSGLPAELAGIFEALAALRFEAPGKLVATVADADLEPTVAALEALTERGLAREVADGEGQTRYAAANEGYETLARERLGPKAWQRLHARASEYLRATDSGVEPAQLAHHCAEAGDTEEALANHTKAASLAQREGHVRAAIDHLRWVVATLAEAEAVEPSRLVAAEAKLAELLHSAGRYADARPVLARALHRANACDIAPGERIGMARSYAESLARLGAIDDARRATYQLLRLTDRSGGLPQALRARATAAEVLRLSGELDAARDVAESALEHPAISPAIRAVLEGELATIAWHQTRLDDAIAHAERSVAAAEEAGDQAAIADGHLTLGTALRMAGKARHAVKPYQDALSVYERLGRVASSGKCLNNLGVCHYLLGRGRAAAEYWNQAVRLAELTGEASEQIILLNNLGYLHLERGQFPQAEEAFDEALSLADRAKRQRLQVIVYGNLGETRARQGDVAEARQLYTAAIRLGKQLESHADVVENRRRLIQLAVDAGDCDEALGELEELLVEAEERHLDSEVAKVSRAAARACLGLGRVEEARTHLERARTYPTEDGDLQSGEQATAEAELALAEGDHEAAEAAVERATRSFERLEAAWHLDRVRELRRSLRVVPEAGEAAGSSVVGPIVIALADEPDVEHASRVVLNAALALTGAERALVYVPPAPGHGGLRVDAGRIGLSQDAWTAAPDPFSRTAARTVLEQARSVCLQNVADDATISAADSVVDLRLRSLLCVPLRVDRRAVGLVYADSRVHIGARFQAALPAVEELAAALALTVDRWRLATLLEAQNRLLRLVTHELRAPLTTLTGHADLVASDARAGAASASVEAVVEVVKREAQRIERILSGLGGVGVDAVTALGEQRPIRPAELVADAVRSSRALARDAGVEITGTTEAQEPEVLADPGRIGQVLANLIVNAVRAAPKGSEIRVGARQLAADSSLGQPPFVRFEVADAGPGVPEADREAIFEWFSRGSQPLGEGTGLGLAIARRIVRSHGGRLWTQPTEPPPPDSQGATFVFTLPVAHPGDRPDV